MIKIAITQAAFEAIAATLPLGRVGFEAERTNVGNVFIWVETRWARKFSACAGWVQAAIVYGPTKRTSLNTDFVFRSARPATAKTPTSL